MGWLQREEEHGRGGVGHIVSLLRKRSSCYQLDCTILTIVAGAAE